MYETAGKTAIMSAEDMESCAEGCTMTDSSYSITMMIVARC